MNKLDFRQHFEGIIMSNKTLRTAMQKNTLSSVIDYAYNKIFQELTTEEAYFKDSDETI